MGFMAGFGKSFSSSFEAGMERNAKRKDDLFKMTYADFIDRRNQVDEYKREDAKAARKAEALVENSGVDPRAYPHVFKQVQSGIDDTVILNDLRTGRFEFDEDQKESVTPEGANEPMGDNDPMSAQMEDSGMSPQEEAAPEAAPAAPEAGGISGLFGKFMGGGSQRRQDRAIGQVADVAGISPDEVRSTLNGTGYQETEVDDSGIRFTPAAADGDFVTLAEAIFKRDQATKLGNSAQVAHFDDMIKSHDLANQMEEARKGNAGNMYLVRGKDGKVTHVMGRPTENGILDPMSGEVLEEVRQVSDEEMKLWDSLATDSDTITDYKKKQADLAGGYALADELVQMAEASPESLTTVGGVTTGIAAIAREIDAAISLIGKSTAVTPEQLEELSTLENQVSEKLLAPGIKNAAEVRTLMEAKLKLAAYRFSALEGEEGRSRSNLDINRFDEILRSSRDPEVFAKNMASYLSDIEKQTDIEGRQLNSYNPTIDAIKRYGYSPVDTIVPTFSDFWEKTAGGEAYDRMVKFHGENPNIPVEMQKPEGDAPVVGAPPLGTVKQFNGKTYEFQGGNHRDMNNWVEVNY